MSAGKYRDRVRVLRPHREKGPTGGLGPTSWLEVGQGAYASLEPVSGRTYVSASQERAEVTMQVLMRYRADVQAGWRLVDLASGLAYEVKAPLFDPRRTESRFMCASVPIG